MKKRLSLLIAPVLALTTLVTGCAHQDAYDVYTTMQAASANAKSADMAFVTNVKATLDGSALAFKVYGDAQYLRNGDGILDLDLKADVAVSMLGESEQYSIYLKDGYLYENDHNGYKIKEKLEITPDEAMALATMDTVTLADLPVNEKAIKSVSVTANADGGKNLDALIDTKIGIEQIKKYCLDLGILTESDFEDLAELNLGYSDIRYIVNTDSKGRMKDQRILFSISMKDEYISTPIVIEFDSYIVVNSYDTLTKIQFPSDLNTYKEYESYYSYYDDYYGDSTSGTTSTNERGQTVYHRD